MMGAGCSRHQTERISNAFLAKVDSIIDDDLVRGFCKKMFSRYGRPSYDPSAFLRIAILGQYLGLKSDRKTLEVIRENICYRRFVSASSTPHASTLSRMRRRLGEDFFKTVFEHTIHLARQRNSLDGEEIYTDCTLIEACASDDKRTVTMRKKGGRSFRENRFDKDAGFVARGKVPPGFYYKAMYTIDSKARIITDCYVFNGKTFDSVPFLDRIRWQRERFQFPLRRVVADAGFGFGPVIRGITALGATPFIPLRSKIGVGKNGLLDGFYYHLDKDIVVCPAGHSMSRYTRYHNTIRYRIDNAACRACPKKKNCADTQKANRGLRYVIRSEYQQEYDMIRFMMEHKSFKKLLKQRQWMIEGLFAEGKGCHGLDRARYRGRNNVQIQIYLIALTQNLKRILCPLARKRKK